jgi:hypothetical protein
MRRERNGRINRWRQLEHFELRLMRIARILAERKHSKTEGTHDKNRQ